MCKNRRRSDAIATESTATDEEPRKSKIECPTKDCLPKAAAGKKPLASRGGDAVDDCVFSIWLCSQHLDVCYSITWYILEKNLRVKPFKIELLQKLNPLHLKKLRNKEWALAKFDGDLVFYRRIVFNDEANFWWNRYVNKQNFYIWHEEQPKALQVLLIFNEKVTIWCGLWPSGIIGRYFLKDYVDSNVKVNGERYYAMIAKYFLPKMQKIDLPAMWFQEDGVTCYTACETMAQLSGDFGEQFVSRLGPVNCLPRLCDLTAVYYFLWGHIKAHFYCGNPAKVDALDANIEEFITELPDDMFEGVCQDLTTVYYILWGHIKAHFYCDNPAKVDALDANIEEFVSELPDDILEGVCQDGTLVYYFLWGHIEAHFYCDNPAKVDALDANIEEFVSEIPDDILQRVCQDWTQPIKHLRFSLG